MIRTILIRYVMGLKKRSLSLVGRGKPRTERYRDQELIACGQERHTKKGLGFFGHVTWQASGWCETAEHQLRHEGFDKLSPNGINQSIA
jgi:hypothetical protein